MQGKMFSRVVAQISTKGEQSNTAGTAGAIREAGGAFGKLGSAKEAEYFYKEVCSFNGSKCSVRLSYFTFELNF